MRVIGSESIRGLRAYFGSLVHVSAREDVGEASRQQSFLATHLLGGVVALCIFPIYLVLVGKPSFLGAVAFLWFLSPIGIAVYLSRTGNLPRAHLISAASLAGLVTYAAWLTGGISSFLLPWMVVVPLEAGLSTNRRIIAGAAGLAALGLGVLVAGQALGYVAAPEAAPLSPLLLGFLGAFSAVAYAAGLALTMQLANTRTEDAIQNGEARYRLLAENASDMITRHDERGRVLFASLGAQQIFGEPATKLHGDGLFERVHVADRPAYLTALSRCYARNEPKSVEFRARRTTIGEPHYLWLELRCRPMKTDLPSADTASRPGVVAVTRDISTHKQVEAELLRARDEAESASFAKTQFLANMSHELRTPLNAVIGFSEILNREMFGSIGEERYRDYARLIHESGEHLLNVVNDVLDMSKIEAGKFKIVKEPFDVASLVKLCSEIMRPAAEKRSVTLAHEVPQGIAELLADKRACKQMLLNIISNAVKFTDPGGRVRVSARAVTGGVQFKVADNGIGISEGDLPKLGSPFVQADNSYDRSYDGAGLGLSVVKGLARLHGGALDIESTLGRGTTVTITLPLDAATESHDLTMRQATASAA